MAFLKSGPAGVHYMTQPENSDSIEAGEVEEENDILVVDPDDYQKTKKLELIHKTKEEVLNVRRNRSKLIGELAERFRGNGVETYQRELGRTVAQYGSELLPLIEEALENGTLEEEDLESQMAPEYKKLDVLEFIQLDGQIHLKGDIDYPPEPNTMAVYRQLDRIQRKLGLGLDLQENKGPANI